jgi:ADP-ribose pyrophosphatase YjhB (NUDIX family)
MSKGRETLRREYPDAPIVAVGVVIFQDRQILLIQRDKEPSKGRWTFPGGAVELGEPLEEAARREAFEETGLDVEIGDVAAVLDNVVRDAEGRVVYHYVIIDYLARVRGGNLVPGTDVRGARWVGAGELDALDVTEKAGELARGLLSAG